MNQQTLISTIFFLSVMKVCLFMAELVFCDFPRNLGDRKIGNCVFSLLINAAFALWAYAVTKGVWG